MASIIDVRRVANVAIRRVIFLLLITPTLASADDRISIVRGGCEVGVHLVARGAPLDHVLARLSEVLGFQVQFIGSSDSVVDIDVARQAPELIRKLSPIDDLIIAQAPDPRCPGRDRVVKVWLLSKGKNNAPPSISASPTTRPAAVSPQPRQMSDAEKRQMRENEDTYRKAHGMPPLEN